MPAIDAHAASTSDAGHNEVLLQLLAPIMNPFLVLSIHCFWYLLSMVQSHVRSQLFCCQCWLPHVEWPPQKGCCTCELHAIQAGVA